MNNKWFFSGLRLSKREHSNLSIIPEFQSFRQFDIGTTFRKTLSPVLSQAGIMVITMQYFILK